MIVKTRTRILLATVVAVALAVLTGLLLLSGNVSAAIWMEGPYFPLTTVLPGSVDTLETMIVIVAVYYFVAALAALTRTSRRAIVVVVLVVIVVNMLGAYAWRHYVARHAGAEGNAVHLVSVGTPPTYRDIRG
jgi:hypothetical protein